MPVCLGFCVQNSNAANYLHHLNCKLLWQASVRQMGTGSFLWSLTKKYITVGLIGLTITDRYVSFVPVRGSSMSPTFNPTDSNSNWGSFMDDRVLVESFVGDVVVLLLGLPSRDVVKAAQGHCWVEGDNPASSMDSRSFGPIPLALVTGRVTHVVWPLPRVGEVRRRISQDRIASP